MSQSKTPLNQRYLFAYFKTYSEKLYYAVSQNGLNWNDYNDGKPILSSNIGNKSIRDPFIIKTKKSYILLSSNGSSSDSFCVWSCDDLLNWKNGRLIQIATKNYCVWAPKAFYDAKYDDYVLIYATGLNYYGSYKRLNYCRTSDFIHFSLPNVLFDPGFSIIDGFIVSNDGHHYLFFKDERGNNTICNNYKRLRVAKSNNMTQYNTYTSFITLHFTEGPCIRYVNDRWILYCDPYEYHCEKYITQTCNNLDDMIESTNPILEWSPIENSFPSLSVRHGCMIELNNIYIDISIN